MTRWPRTGDVFGPAELFEPGGANGGVRWTPKKREPKFNNEAARSSVPTVKVLVTTPVAAGDVVAIGDHTGADPADVDTVHEVTEYRETPNVFDTYTVQHAIVKPLLGQLRQTVRIFPIYRETSGRSYTMKRAALLYDGPASVDMSSGNRTDFADSAVIEYDTIVTVPYTVGIDASTRYEIEWGGPFGMLILDSQGPFFNNQQSPFWRSLACITRRQQTTVNPGDLMSLGKDI